MGSKDACSRKVNTPITYPYTEQFARHLGGCVDPPGWECSTQNKERKLCQWPGWWWQLYLDTQISSEIYRDSQGERETMGGYVTSDKKKKTTNVSGKKLFLALIFGVYHHDGALDGRQFFTVVMDAESRAHLPRFKSKACQLLFLYTQVIFNSLCLSFPIYQMRLLRFSHL